jgi:hypothetical protein
MQRSQKLSSPKLRLYYNTSNGDIYPQLRSVLYPVAGDLKPADFTVDISPAAGLGDAEIGKLLAALERHAELHDRTAPFKEVWVCGHTTSSNCTNDECRYFHLGSAFPPGLSDQALLAQQVLSFPLSDAAAAAWQLRVDTAASQGVMYESKTAKSLPKHLTKTVASTARGAAKYVANPNAVARDLASTVAGRSRLEIELAYTNSELSLEVAALKAELASTKKALARAKKSQAEA